ncbi:hypothetical protein [Billgrantia montanilacus]|uniref:hypothetical protein n=1 Tax=Billgrantia montanilacus TaxID=2282305 RepID=UPI0011C05530|nr:hypothetical protein [Halomonas montanilacus]
MAIYVHIGLPRAASTTLQKTIFPNIEHVAYIGIGKSNIPGLDMDASLFSGLWNSHGEEFDTISSKWNSKLNHALMYAKSTGKDIVVSFEGWCRPSHTIEINELANRISQVFRNPTIILLLRNPVDWIESCYGKVVWNQFRTRDVHDPIDLSSINKYYDLVKSDEKKFFGVCGIEPQTVIDAFSGMKQIIIPAEYLVANKFKAVAEINNRWQVSTIVIKKNNERQGIIAMSLARLWFRCPPFVRRLTRDWIISIAPKLDAKLKIRDNCRLSKKTKKSILENYNITGSRAQESTIIKLKGCHYFDVS